MQTAENLVVGIEYLLKNGWGEHIIILKQGTNYLYIWKNRDKVLHIWYINVKEG